MTKQKKPNYNELKKMIDGHKRTIELGNSQYTTLNKENNMLRDRLKQIAGENEGYREDIRWFKQVIQNLIGKSNAIAR